MRHATSVSAVVIATLSLVAANTLMSQERPDSSIRVEQSRGSQPYRDAVRRYLRQELPKIVNGKLAKSGDYAWQVSLGATKIPDTYYAHFCGGSVYSASIIVTAAHCVVGNSARDIVVTAGTITLGEGDMRRYVKRIIVKAGYNSRTQDMDIALLELAAPLTLTPGRVEAIPLLSLEDEPSALPVQAPLIVTGWGVTNESSNATSRSLQYAEVPFVANRTCNSPLANNGRITDAMLCAGYSNGGIDACYGDSGGALALKNVGQPKLVGIVSWGEGCARPEKYGVYTRVPVFAKWVGECATAPAACKND